MDYSHPFIREALEQAKDTLIAGAEHVNRNQHREAEAQAENRARMKAHERYATNVLRRTQGLFGTIQALDDARRLITMFPSQLSRSRSAISRDRWVDYHYGYFTVSLASLPDIGIVLTAAVLQLGLAHRHCTADVVISHDRVAGTKIAKALRGLGKSVKGVKERRNLHVHRGELADAQDLSSDTFLRDLKTLTFLHSVGSDLADRDFIAEGWREAKKEIAPRLQQEQAQVTAAMSGLLDALLPEYRTMITLLRALDLKNPPPAA